MYASNSYFPFKLFLLKYIYIYILYLFLLDFLQIQNFSNLHVMAYIFSLMFVVFNCFYTKVQKH